MYNDKVELTNSFKQQAYTTEPWRVVKSIPSKDFFHSMNEDESLTQFIEKKSDVILNLPWIYLLSKGWFKERFSEHWYSWDSLRVWCDIIEGNKIKHYMSIEVYNSTELINEHKIYGYKRKAEHNLRKEITDIISRIKEHGIELKHKIETKQMHDNYAIYLEDYFNYLLYFNSDLVTIYYGNVEDIKSNDFYEIIKNDKSFLITLKSILKGLFSGQPLGLGEILEGIRNGLPEDEKEYFNEDLICLNDIFNRNLKECRDDLIKLHRRTVSGSETKNKGYICNLNPELCSNISNEERMQEPLKSIFENVWYLSKSHFVLKNFINIRKKRKFNRVYK